MNKLERSSNIELLRIISMIFVVANHYVFHGASVYEGNNVAIGYMLGSFDQLGVSLFVFIGSYFLVDKSFNIRRIFHLWKQVFFYSVSISTFVLIFPPPPPQNTCLNFYLVDPWSYLLHSIFVILFVFFVCVIIDFIIKSLFPLGHINIPSFIERKFANFDK